MNTSFRHETAKIYQFPVKTASGFNGHRGSAKPVTELKAQTLPEVEFGSGWYHEAAVQDAERPRKS